MSAPQFTIRLTLKELSALNGICDGVWESERSDAEKSACEKIANAWVKASVSRAHGNTNAAQ